MFDYRTIIILLIGLVSMFVVGYTCQVILTPQVLFWLLPIALALIIIVGCLQIRTPRRLRLLFTVGTVILIAVSIYIFIKSQSNKYSHLVFTTSIKVVWVVIIAATVLYWKDPQRSLKMGLLRTILLLGLFASIYFIPPLDANLLPDQVAAIVADRSGAST